MHLYEPAPGKLFTTIVEHIGFSNSFVDVILFVWLNQGTKRELKSLLLKKKEKPDLKNQRTITKKITKESLFNFDEHGSLRTVSTFIMQRMNASSETGAVEQVKAEQEEDQL